MMKIYQILTLFSLILFTPNQSLCSENANVFRRHYLVFYDISGTFQTCEHKNPELKSALIHLFQNHGLNSGRQSLFQFDQNTFFNPEQDEISFLFFGISGNDYKQLRFSYNQDDPPEQLFSTFGELFFQDQVRWSDFQKNKSSLNVKEYFNEVLPQNFVKFGNGITLSNLVYPMGLLNEINSAANEYYLIIISDFLSGSMFGNRQDYKLLSEMFYNNKEVYQYFVANIEQLENEFYTIKVLEADFPTNCLNDEILLGFVGYKVKPFCGIDNADNPSLKINSNFYLSQTFYNTPIFRIPDIDISFTHTNKLEVSNVGFSLTDIDDNVIFSDEIANIDNGLLRSTFVSMEIEYGNGLYSFPSVKYRIPELLTNKMDTVNLIINLATNYSFLDNQTIRFNYRVSRTIDKENIYYRTKTTIVLMEILIPLAAVIVFLLVLLYIGRPKTILFNIEDLADTYEKFDYEGEGRIKAPFLAWNASPDKTSYSFLVSYELHYNSRLNYFWRKIPVYLTLNVDSCPRGFEVFIEKEDGVCITEDNEFRVFCYNKVSQIKIVFNQIDSSVRLEFPELVKLQVKAIANISRIFSVKFEKAFLYNFYAGEPLGNVFISFDPGTTGSCVMSGTETDDIFVEKDIFNEEVITHSIVSFIKDYDKPIDTARNLFINNEFIECGNSAYQMINRKNRHHFISIKKMLGYTNMPVIKMDNRVVNGISNNLKVSGIELSSILINHLYQQHKASVRRNKLKNLMDSNVFTPQRAVFAIPNNFTATKITALKKSVDSLNLFKEIRFIYEAEAILVDYLFKGRKTKSGKTIKLLDNERILIFDMGGATINATLAQLKVKNHDGSNFYDIDILAKLGYGIGGDTIDYYLLSFINQKLVENGKPERFLVDRKNRIVDSMMALDIKKRMIKHIIDKDDYLLNEYDLLNLFNLDQSALKQDAFRNSKDADFYTYFERHVLKNIDDIIGDIFKLAHIESVDTVIMAGRSLMFQYIEDYLKESLGSNNITFDGDRAFKYDKSRLKTVVARGACLYGVNRNAIKLSNMKTNSSFGFKHTKAAGEPSYFELIELGEQFNHYDDNAVVDNKVEFQDQFSLDANQVKFLQVMGFDANEILNNDEKHKFTTLSKVNVQTRTNKIGLRVSEKDDVTCIVEETNGEKTIINAIVNDDDIMDANAVHYTWIIDA